MVSFVGSGMMEGYRSGNQSALEGLLWRHMNKLRIIEKLSVDVLADNLTDSYSSKPHYCSPEFNNVLAAGATELSAATLCCAQLGLGLMMRAEAGGECHKLLFDAGPDGAILLGNARKIGAVLSDVEAVAISHGHWDHMGGLLPALRAIASGDSSRRVFCHVNPGMFVERGARLSTGAVALFQKVPSPTEIEACGVEVVNNREARLLLDDFFYLSGEIPRVSSFEKGRGDHLCRDSAGDSWRPDPLIMDERYVAVHVQNKGMVVYSSCSHAGIVNVLTDVRNNFPEVPIYAAFGGLHLAGEAMERLIPETVAGLKQFNCKQIIPAHCSGWRAVRALANEFGEDVVSQSAVGSRYVF
jgi:7,8-dihydropterin-6-yl-methyl-4-(beta-D-ribofuranosyl)aminobenzene 5'-phosphate synthase